MSLTIIVRNILDDKIQKVQYKTIDSGVTLGGLVESMDVTIPDFTFPYLLSGTYTFNSGSQRNIGRNQ